MFTKKQVNVGYWNIKGIKDVDGSFKTNYPEVFNRIKSHDVFCISECQCGEDDVPIIPDYYCFKLCRGVNARNNRYYGGLIIYVKNDIRKGVKFLEHLNEDYVWLKMDKTFFGLDRDLYLCMLYIPPVSSTYYQKREHDTLSFIESDIQKYCTRGSISLLGDFNARTGRGKDFVYDDVRQTDDDLDFYEVDKINITRNSMDKSNVCSRGRKLLEICVASRIRILNGRCIGDSFGGFTSFQPNGNSVIDYLICDEDNVVNIRYLKLLGFIGNVSDHICISFSMNCNYLCQNNKLCKKNIDAPLPYIWDESSIFQYQSQLSSESIKCKIAELVRKPLLEREGLNNYLLKLNDVYVSAASNALKRTKKKQGKMNGSHKKWFTKDLSLMRNEVKTLGRKLRSSPHNNEVRKVYYTYVRNYNRERKRCSRTYRQEMINKLDMLRDNNPQEYWKLLSQIKGTVQADDCCIPLDEWFEYFKVLNKTDKPCTGNRNKVLTELHRMEQHSVFNDMDFSISEKEISMCIKRLKNKKAVGYDLISNEMLRYSQHALLPALSLLFNGILTSKLYPSQWCESFIVPIYKSGGKEIPSNYRGLSIFSCLAKLFNTVLNTRLVDFLEKNNLISPCQIGFRKGSRTSDHMLTLNTLIEKYTKNKNKLYACFVDFKKAFDRVDHNFLLYKLKKMGISDSIYGVLKDLYVNQGSKLSVRSNGLLSNSFTSQIGVRQGDPLSPTLFNVFINDIVQYVENDCSPLLNGKNLHCLLYADDLVLLSTSKDGIQCAVNGLENYVKDWGIEVNVSKTKMMVFNSEAILIEPNVKLGDVAVESVCSYKYLGLLLNVKGNLEVARKDLLDRGLKAMFKLTSLFKVFKPSYLTSVHLFDSVVKPVLLYGADICGFKPIRKMYSAMKNSLFEKCHLKFLRFVLGVNKRAPNIGVYGDTGRLPLSLSANTQFLKNWYRINDVCTKNKSGLLADTLKENIKMNGTWYKSLKCLLKFINESPESALTRSTSFITKKTVQFCASEFKLGWRNELNNDVRANNGGNKLRTYRKFKNIFYTEPYLTDCVRNIQRFNIARLRLSSHKLQIEVGRYSGGSNRVAPEDRLCCKCNLNVCEDELHFFMKCDLYNNTRNAFILNEEISNIVTNNSSQEAFNMLMSSSDKNVINTVGKFVTDCFSLRNDANV